MQEFLDESACRHIEQGAQLKGHSPAYGFDPVLHVGYKLLGDSQLAAKLGLIHMGKSPVET